MCLQDFLVFMNFEFQRFSLLLSLVTNYISTMFLIFLSSILDEVLVSNMRNYKRKKKNVRVSMKTINTRRKNVMISMKTIETRVEKG